MRNSIRKAVVFSGVALVVDLWVPGDCAINFWCVRAEEATEPKSVVFDAVLNELVGEGIQVRFGT